ncbi:hypothetical protein EDC01DRAFT_759585 [Geopyxis carbonaria]|nr:hypothetical protein EDC01DRAFT_759585 [Geopyxis carbonaria]
MRLLFLLAAAAPVLGSILNFDDLNAAHVPGCGCCDYVFGATESYHGFLIQGPNINIFNTTLTLSCRQSPGGVLNLHGASSLPNELQARAGNVTFAAAGDAGALFTVSGARPSTRYRNDLWGKDGAWVFLSFVALDADEAVLAVEERGFLTSTDTGGMGPWVVEGLDVLGKMAALTVKAEWRYENTTSKAELYVDDLEYEFEV